MATLTVTRSGSSTLAGNRLHKSVPWITLLACIVVSAAVFALLAASNDVPFNLVGTSIIAVILYLVAIFTLSAAVEGRRQATDRFVTGLVTSAFVLAMVPLVSVSGEVVVHGWARMDGEFSNSSMRNITGEGGGALHAMVGTLLITLAATVISVPLGLMTSIYLVEYGRGRLATVITFLVDVMTGIPSIVAGLFAYALFAIFFGPGVRMGIVGDRVAHRTDGAGCGSVKRRNAASSSKRTPRSRICTRCPEMAHHCESGHADRNRRDYHRCGSRDRPSDRRDRTPTRLPQALLQA